ncbi:uncharacterized protein HMPREF1541_03927 [Cyphellophora europaea CBS 101466]|uniref:ADF-H domain-containing protein n=1 Tax=Cyphellophora europaea (strain CBS 101466) TaxID=1220924 RepID=W2S1R8_CYPE1|nr:uncharacterized protein HMPREF1541_03927 [Cyphellophora europaea CBS 101466]ETN41988.1 hypothetical protein HMPREF1541_03927 [Cyphellophora europaea CBS 101466]
MSLAGLDTPAVVEAHQASIADPTGWFLLKYEDGSRDTVEVFKTGTGGVPEARNAVESYQEKSPLYGMVQHRRRKVILKYVPEGTSRILQVRLTVQFQTVVDAFTPHDFVFSFITPSELSEPAIGVQTMLAPSAGSITSSSSSLRRRRLKDISEDAEEPAAVPPEKTSPLSKSEEKESAPVQPEEKREEEADELPASALRAKALLAMRISPEIDITDHDDPASRPRSTTSHKLSGADDPTSFDTAPILPPIPISPGLDKDLPPPPEADREGTREHAGERGEENVDNSEEPQKQLTIDQLRQSPHLSQADNTSISRWSSDVAAYTVKPKKKKLGPRPHVDPPGRPRTSNLSDTGARPRPVANLPTTVKVSSDRARGPPLSFRPSSQQSSKSVPGRFPPNHPMLPPVPSPTHMSGFFRQESRSVMPKTPSLTSEIPSGATPEKIRLMKALQLRKRNMLAAQRASMVQEAEMESGENGNLADPKLVSSTASPTTATNASEDHSRAEESSFTSRDEPLHRQASLSSDTSSSITPRAKAELEDKPPKALAKEEPIRAEIAPRAPPKNESEEKETKASVKAFEGGDEKEARAAVGSSIETSQGHRTAPVESRQADPKASGDDSAAVTSAPSSTALREKRGLAVPQPLHISAGAELSEQSDGESFMDELANATVHEAKPVLVGRTPVTPIMSAPALRDYKDGSHSGEPTVQPRSSSSGQLEKPRSSSGRSTSALPHWPPLPTEPVPQPLSKKSTLGSGISKRIKALEVLSTRDSTSPPRQSVRDIPSKRSALDTFMKRSSFMKQAPNASTDQSPPKKLPESQSMAPTVRTAMFSRGGENEKPGLFAPAPKGEAVSVTARIVRDHDLVPPSTAPGDLNLHRSPLIVEHERPGDQRPSFSRDSKMQDPPRSPQKGARFSFSSYRSANQARLNTADSSSKLSFTSKAKIPRSVSDNSSLSEDKAKGSRAQRLMKRVSNLTGRRGTKNLSSSSVVDFHPQEHPDTIEEERNERNGSVAESLLHVVDIGDVNVQFPETLLWKRRFIRIDDQGYLIFSPPANDPNLRNVSRKFHLGDFRQPTLPDLEREQMAWSVLLDLKDGSCIQCACENRAAQQQVLQMLVDAHSAYHQLYVN